MPIKPTTNPAFANITITKQSLDTALSTLIQTDAFKGSSLAQVHAHEAMAKQTRTEDEHRIQNDYFFMMQRALGMGLKPMATEIDLFFKTAKRIRLARSIFEAVSFEFVVNHAHEIVLRITMRVVPREIEGEPEAWDEWSRADNAAAIEAMKVSVFSEKPVRLDMLLDVIRRDLSGDGLLKYLTMLVREEITIVLRHELDELFIVDDKRPFDPHSMETIRISGKVTL